MGVKYGLECLDAKQERVSLKRNDAPVWCILRQRWLEPFIRLRDGGQVMARTNSPGNKYNL